jgi:hypothetical protein
MSGPATIDSAARLALRVARAEARHAQLEEELDAAIAQMRELVARLEAEQPKQPPALTVIEGGDDA